MKRLLIVQYAGDYRESDRLRREEGKEIYYGHGYVLDQLEAVVATGVEVGFLCCLAPKYEERLPNGIVAIGTDTNPDRNPRPVIEAMAKFRPTHLWIQGPMPSLIRWGLRHSGAAEMAVVLADSFANRFYRWLRFDKLPPMLRDPRVTLIANHGANAARALVDLGVDSGRVVPWDYPHVRTPDQWPAKTRAEGPPFELLYVGFVSAKKGVGDLIDAVARLAPALDVRLTVAGVGKVGQFEKLAARRSIADRVRFLGLVPNNEIPAMMHRAAAVVVPSRHSFPEGLPLTLYEALSSRTPVIASDHPMFGGHLVDGESAMIFPAGNAGALAAAIEDVLTRPDLYERLSAGAPAAWERMQNPVKWGEMVARWVRGEPADREWLASHSVAHLPR
jgi:glycosyltransferase involved in cell wall biosynthesis